MLALLLLVVPASLFAAAALAHAKREPGGRRGLLVLAATAVAVLGAVGTGILAWRSGDAGVVLVLLPWSRSVFDASVVLTAFPLTAAVLLLIAILGLLTAAHASSIDRLPASSSALAIAGASALFVLGAAAPLGLVLTWLVLDIALFVTCGRSRHTLLSGQLGLVFALAAMVTLPWESSATGMAAGAPYAALTGLGRFCLLSAGAIRMGLYPVWWAVPPTERDAPWASLGTRLAPVAAGGYLVLLVSALAPLGSGLSSATLLPALASIVAASILVYLAPNRSEAQDWQIGAQAGLLLMAALIGGQVGQAVGLLVLVDLVLVRAGLLLADTRPGGIASRIALWVLALAAAGVPPTLGFAGRWLLYRDLLFGGMGGAVVAIVIATAITTGRLWDTLRLPAPGRRLGRTLLLSLAALAVLELLLGLAVPRLSGLLAGITGTSLPSPLALAWAGLANRSTVGITFVSLLAVVLPAGAALFMRPDPLRSSDARRRGIRRALRATQVASGLATLVVHLGALVDRISGLLESRRAMAWTVMAATVTAAAMVIAPPSAAPVGDRSGLIGLAVFALAAGIGATLVLGRAPGLTIGALAASYLFAASVELLSDVPPQVAFMELTAGLLAAIILGVGVLQAPIDRRLVGAARRLAAVGGARDTEGQVLPALALIVALVLSYGMQSAAMSEAFPTQIVRPAFALAGCGVLAAVFARSPLRLAAGVLGALTGFEIAYAQLDPGLLVSAGLAAFQLLFAVVASYYVAMPLRDEVAEG